jgi:hypothetical protein
MAYRQVAPGQRGRRQCNQRCHPHRRYPLSVVDRLSQAENDLETETALLKKT